MWLLLLLINFTAPSVIYAGEMYEVAVDIYTNESLNGTLYTYVYRGLNCISTGWWHGIDVKLKPGENHFVLRDSVSPDAPEGFYRLKVKLVAGEKWEKIKEVEVRHRNFPYFALIPIIGAVFLILRWLL